MHRNGYLTAMAVAMLAIAGAARAETAYVGGPKGLTDIRVPIRTAAPGRALARATPSRKARPVDHIHVGGPKSDIAHVSR